MCCSLQKVSEASHCVRIGSLQSLKGTATKVIMIQSECNESYQHHVPLNSNYYVQRHEDPIIHFKPSRTDHLGKQRQYWRDIILGINDRLISTFLLVIGVSGGGLTSNDVFITAIAGAMTGAISMFAGEYMATKSQDEVLEGEIQLENDHIREYHSDEDRELPALLSMIGVPSHGQESLRNQLIEFYASDEDALLKIMVALEFGVLESERRNARVAGLTSGALFFIDSLSSLIPYAICIDPMNGLFLATSCTCVVLLVVGVVKSFVTRMNCFYSSVENFVIVGLGGLFAYLIGAKLK